MAQRSEFYYVHKPLAKYRIHETSMHHRFIKDRTGEKGMRSVLDHFLPGNNDEVIGQAETKKIYGLHYRRFGYSYFGEGMSADARRCFLKALFYDKSHLAEKEFFFLFIGSLMGRTLYDKAKSFFTRSFKQGIKSKLNTKQHLKMSAIQPED